MRHSWRIFWMGVVVVVIGLQFIRPRLNRSAADEPADMLRQLRAPAEVANVFQTACYDCHSNNTTYPWYSKVQPIAWLLNCHIKNGKAELNFNEFASYSKRRQASKLKSIQHSLEEGTMPLPSYTWMHKGARLSGAEKKIVTDWIDKMIDSTEN